MKLKDAVAQFDTYSGRASDNVRALAFAGLAFVWLVAREELSGVQGDLLLAAALLLLALFADFAHYVIAGVRWDLFVRDVEKKNPDTVSPETPISYDDSHVAPIYWAYYMKVVVIVIAYVVLTYVVLSRIGTQTTVLV
jgi:small-conductance mechanosensitive channel